MKVSESAEVSSCERSCCDYENFIDLHGAPQEDVRRRRAEANILAFLMQAGVGRFADVSSVLHRLHALLSPNQASRAGATWAPFLQSVGMRMHARKAAAFRAKSARSSTTRDNINHPIARLHRLNRCAGRAL